MNLDGAMAWRLVYPAAHLYRINPQVSPKDAVMGEPLAIAARALTRLEPDGTAPVLIVGAGTLGCLAIMIAVSRGLPVFAADTRASRLDVAVELGAQPAPPDERFTFVLNASSSAGGLDAAFARLDLGGRLVGVGLTGRELTPVPVDSLVVSEQVLIGSLGSAGGWEEAVALIDSGLVRPSRLVTHEFEFDAYADALATLASHDQSVGKVIISI